MGHAVITDDNGIARLGIARLAPLARADLERPEAPQLDHAVREESGLDLLEEEVDDPVDILLACLDQG